MVGPEDILDFWLNEIGRSGWYEADEALDDQIRDRFEPAWQAAKAGELHHWLSDARSVLAYVILTDQFPRNMFRGDGAAFSTDKLALAASKMAVDLNWDLKVAEPERQFFYLPMMHSENLCDQDRCVRLMCERMPELGAPNLLHAKAHREIIRTFGRFPFRNAALSRRTTSPERAFVTEGGYGQTVRRLQAG